MKLVKKITTLHTASKAMDILVIGVSYLNKKQ